MRTNHADRTVQKHSDRTRFVFVTDVNGSQCDSISMVEPMLTLPSESRQSPSIGCTPTIEFNTHSTRRKIWLPRPSRYRRTSTENSARNVGTTRALETRLIDSLADRISLISGGPGKRIPRLEHGQPLSNTAVHPDEAIISERLHRDESTHTPMEL